MRPFSHIMPKPTLEKVLKEFWHGLVPDLKLNSDTSKKLDCYREKLETSLFFLNEYEYYLFTRNESDAGRIRYECPSLNLFFVKLKLLIIVG